ncbi:MAG: hypothetical protein HY738_04300 [Bacteroidia bacterium]|nr:hypothetical protein [Bacteroidia bacterium]
MRKPNQLTPEEKIKHFKNVVKVLMNDASKVLAEIELISKGDEMEEKISLLNHYVDYTKRLCESNESAKVYFDYLSLQEKANSNAQYN